MAETQTYDLRGLKCPLPVLKTRRRMAKLNPGDELIVETSDPLAGIDIPHFCHEDGHALLSQERLEDGLRFHIRKGQDHSG
jgi:tRNA 2-thiouridine synthesizing protein A